MLRSPLACRHFDKASQIHAFIQRFIHLTDICDPAVHTAKDKIQHASTEGTRNWPHYIASASADDVGVDAARASRQKRVALEDSVQGVWTETRLLCETLGCHLPQPLSARQSDVIKNSKWEHSLHGIKKALRECNRACMGSGIGVDDGLEVKMRAWHQAYARSNVVVSCPAEAVHALLTFSSVEPC